tara:strand:- start:921 stop:1139 length:219 start_codon:yes stop_codon:yes gene_type:complete
MIKSTKFEVHTKINTKTHVPIIPKYKNCSITDGFLKKNDLVIICIIEKVMINIIGTFNSLQISVCELFEAQK